MTLTYNSFTLPGVLQEIDSPVAVRMRTSDVARGAAYSQGGVMDAKRIKIKGLVKCYSIADQITQEDSINARLPIGKLLPLVMTSGANRYYPAEVEGITITKNERNSSLTYEVSFYVPGGCAVAVNESTASYTASGGTLVLSGGTEIVRPRVSVVFGTVFQPAFCRIANSATGETITFAPTDAATRILSSDGETITLTGGTDKTAEWLSGDFLTLALGGNPISVVTSNCSVLNVTFTYRPKWR